MAVTVGSISKVSVGSSTANLSVPAATGGTAPYVYVYNRATSGSTFTAGTANQIQSGSSLTLADSGLTPGTTYYYKVEATDANSAVGSSAALQVVTTAASPNVNQFTVGPLLGMLDLRFNGNTIAVQLDPAGTNSVVAGQALVFSTTSDQQSASPYNSAPGIPLVNASGSASDVFCGYVNYNIKDAVFAPGDLLEMSMAGNVMYLYAALAVNRGQFLTSLPAAQAGGCNGGVVPVTGSSGFPIIGYSLDTGAIGTLIRVMLATPAAAYAID